MTLNLPRNIRDHRYKCEVDISHDNVIPDIHYDGIISNLSDGGVYFESNESIFPGDEISVTVKKLNEEKITFDIYIIWKKDLPNPPFRFGYGAKTVSPEESVVQIHDQDVNRITEAGDKREYQRKIFNMQIRFKNHNQSYNGRIIDISHGGAFIETDSIFPAGKKIVLTISGKTARKSFKLTGWIVRKNNEGFGVSFDRRSGVERRYDIDRRKDPDRRNRKRTK